MMMGVGCRVVLLGIDIGTTHGKAALFETDGAPIRLTTLPTITHQGDGGHPYHDPEEVWDTVVALICEVMTDVSPADVTAVGVASMAEAGLLIDVRTGQPRSPIIPWFDTRSAVQAAELVRAGDTHDTFCRTGLYPSYKCGLAKLLWLRAHDAAALRGAIWLSVADYIVFRLTDCMATDPTLAARTYAYRIDDHRWDEPRICALGLDPALFPPVRPSGSAAGTVHRDAADATGLAAGTPVAVAGHDHLCAALAAGVVTPGRAVDSMGTAESIVGVLPGPSLGDIEFRSGLTFGPHVLPGRYCWMGGLPASGGSVEWLRAQLNHEPLSYDSLARLLSDARPGPSGILYFPYLSGSGAPLPDPHVRAAFVGVTAAHGRADLVKAVLEGTAFEVESIRRAATRVTGVRIEELVAVGGGAKNECWLRIKADIAGCRLLVPALAETTLLGAALVAGIGCGTYVDEDEALKVVEAQAATRIDPDLLCHQAYLRWYGDGYLALQEPLRRFGAAFTDLHS